MVLCMDSGYTTVWTGCLETSSSPRELKTQLPPREILTDKSKINKQAIE